MTPLLLAAALAVPLKPDPSADLFKPAGPVPKVVVTVEPDALKQLRQDPRKYVRCTARVGDGTFPDAGVHLKGAAGSFRDWNDKPGLTLNLDKFGRRQSFRGLVKFNLNNAVQDGSYLQELLTYEMAAAAGLPACRCTHVLVELNGRK